MLTNLLGLCGALSFLLACEQRIEVGREWVVEESGADSGLVARTDLFDAGASSPENGEDDLDDDSDDDESDDDEQEDD